MLTAAAVTANAADMPIRGPYMKAPLRSVVSYYNWTGFYVGANVGYGFGNSTWATPFDIDTKPKGMMYGVTAGINWQAGAVVYGIEADYAWSSVKGSATCALGLATCETANSYLATFRGRLGYAFDRFLPYFTAGGAYGDIKATLSAPAVPQTASKSNLGWVVGAGLEYAMFGNWTAKVEYLYADLGKFDPGFVAPVTSEVTFKESIVRAGLNYKFSGPIFSRF
jgi:outer membrane immunogenic protein